MYFSCRINIYQTDALVKKFNYPLPTFDFAGFGDGTDPIAAMNIFKEYEYDKATNKYYICPTFDEVQNWLRIQKGITLYAVPSTVYDSSIDEHFMKGYNFGIVKVDETDNSKVDMMMVDDECYLNIFSALSVGLNYIIDNL